MISSKSKQILKNLITTESINKNSLDKITYEELKNLGFIYEDNGFCYLTVDLKNIIKNNLSAKQPQQKEIFKKRLNKKVSDILTINIKKNNQLKLNFFEYLVLILGYINRLNHEKISRSKIKIYLSKYLHQINNSKILYTK